ncbi:MAG: 1-acyl-sn-glycerol-3-phosphate acyltransferase [Ruminococcus sp.]|nr:1-acyl-sn-glycerol-3-phosphate acyltransferase [Ruminococcus sp.]MBQ1687085.1 1-acyl-sn-glycerol-3-phosphate acyltransferase [Ruminococcus sp.]MBQ2475174.1 1-acyl-sn-glycerol-3-phosphate acyltransferase [Ruminococcus sp.]
MSVQKKAKLFSLRCLLMDLIRITGALPGLVWLRPKIRYTAKQAKKRLRGGVLVIANHTSFIDPACMMYVLWYRRLYFVCHQAFVETKAGPFFRAAGCLIPINADNFSVGSFRSITESLRDGKAVTLFPEGHVNKGDEMLEFKSGMVLISMQSKRPIVPVYLKPRRHWYSRLKAVVGEPVDITSLSEGRPAFSKIQEVTALLKKREEELEAFAETI